VTYHIRRKSTNLLVAIRYNEASARDLVNYLNEVDSPNEYYFELKES
jgi:hypothetical protein